MSRTPDRPNRTDRMNRRVQPPPQPSPRRKAPARLRERLAAARQQYMVGRAAELALLRAALRSREPAFAVLHIHGPGGVGKTTLLRAYRELAERAGRMAVWIDGHELDPSPDSFLRAAGVETGTALRPGTVVLIDGYEYLAPLDGWLRERFLPDLPARSLVVIAGREPPASAWRAEPEWSVLTSIVALRNFEPEESRAYLRRRRIARTHHDAVLSFTHGHPLAISLVADVLARDPALPAFDPREQPDVLRALLDRLVRDMPGPEYRRALEVCAHARATTEALLAHALDTLDASSLFAWLRGLSLVEHGPHGLVPHDLVREVLEADLRWRDPDGYRRLHRRVREHVLARLTTSTGIEQQQAFFDLIYLHRNSPVMRPYYSWKTLGSAYAEPLASDCRAAALALVRRVDGERGAGLVRQWLARQPEAFFAFRGPGRRTFGYAATLVLRDVRAEDVADDILLRALHEHAHRNGAPRPGEALLIARYWSKETPEAQAVSANLIAMLSTRSWLTTPAVAWSFTAPPAGEPWNSIFAHLNFEPVREAAFELNGRRYAVYAHDWRAEPPAAWLERMAERELGAAPPPEAPARAAQRLVLSRPDFAAAVRRALRDYTRPVALSESPLLRSRVLLDRAPHGAAAADLRALLREGAESLRANPKDAKRYRALWHTFFQPAATQERAAERLGLAFNTYRYHLYGATDALIEWLWQRELNGPNP